MNKKPFQIGWLSTGGGPGSYGLLKTVLDYIDNGKLNIQISFVFCNREEGQDPQSDRFIEFINERGINLLTLSSKKFRQANGNVHWSKLRENFDETVLSLIQPYNTDMIVNAGYMLIAPILCEEMRMINVHPALPTGPIGMWKKVIWELIDQRATETGVMIHIVTKTVDGGPVISFCRFPLRGELWDPFWEEIGDLSSNDLKEQLGECSPLFKAIRREGINRERILLVETLDAISDGQINLDQTSTYNTQDFTDIIETSISY